MQSPYNPPSAHLTLPDIDFENTSGMGKGHPIPDGVKGWSWGAFLLNWLWALFNKNAVVALLCFFPLIGLFAALWLGFNGRERAWRNKRWDSLEHFNRVQRAWTVWGLCLLFIPFVLGVLAAIMIPAYQHSVGH
jgi:hypothetical protein